MHSHLYRQALLRVLSGQEDVSTVVTALDIPYKPFQQYLCKHGYAKTLEMPIVLFDLNGTLCHRTENNRVITLRPYIQELKKLKKKYRLGVFTSVIGYNAHRIIHVIEKECGRIFDKNLIFTREHTLPLTEDELVMHNLAPFKMKKSLNHILAPEVVKKTVIVDDEIARIEEQDHAIPIVGWYGDCETDDTLKTIVANLMAE